MLKWFIKPALFIVSFVLFVYSGMMGLFAAVGICCVIWGDDILHTALGKTPDYGHPAFYLWVLLMIPSMLLGFAGGFFLIVLPICSTFDIRLPNTPASAKQTAMVCDWYVKLLQKFPDRHAWRPARIAGREGRHVE
jgi:hypothetical protein